MSDDKDTSLLAFVSQVSGESVLKVEETFSDGYVRLNTSEAQRRQAKHDIQWTEDIVVEMLRNSRDAKATKIFVASHSEGPTRYLTVLDDGLGVPEHMRELIFEPRVTSKLETMVIDDWGVHGRGMALYSIRENVPDIALVASDRHKGAAFRLNVDTTRLRERSDQSTWPKVTPAKSSDDYSVAGPRNIVRHVIEFALAHPDIELYIGSSADIAATLVLLANTDRFTHSPGHQTSTASLALWRRPAFAYNAGDLADICEEIGLSISERTAHRIMRSEIAPLKPVLSGLVASTKPQEKLADIYRDVRGLKIDASDLEAFRGELEDAFDRLAAKYYLIGHDDVKIRVGKSAITVTYGYEKES